VRGTRSTKSPKALDGVGQYSDSREGAKARRIFFSAPLRLCANKSFFECASTPVNSANGRLEHYLFAPSRLRVNHKLRIILNSVDTASDSQ